jgi:hypothetical protein
MENQACNQGGGQNETLAFELYPEAVRRSTRGNGNSNPVVTMRTIEG